MRHGTKNETEKCGLQNVHFHKGEKNGRLSEIVKPLLQWFDSHARILPWRDNPSPYAVWISEIMLQQTRVEAVKPYFDRWMKTFPDLSSLAGASEAEVLKLWEGLGYYSRARNIHRTARLVMEKYGGRLPSSFEELRSLPGVGEYTAGAVGSIAFRLPVPCVDGNVLRVITRLTAEEADIGVAATKKLLTGWVREIIPDDRPGDFNQALMELGATVCLPNGSPKCGACPVTILCEALIRDRISEFPVKGVKQPRKIEEKTVLILLRDKKAALRKRPDTGLLAGLWEFPNYDGALSEEEVRRILTGSGLKASSLVKLKKAKHIFSHIEWEMTGYLAFIQDDISPESGASGMAETGPDYGAVSDGSTPGTGMPGGKSTGFQWTGMDQLEHQLALPAAFKTYFSIMKHYIKI